MTRFDSPISTGQQIEPGRAEQPHLLYRLARWARLLTGLLLIWWPLAPIWLALLVAGPLGLVLLSPVGLAIAVVPAWRSWMRARLRSSAEATYSWGWRASWPKICGLAGLTYVLAHRTRIPQLVSIEKGPGVWPAWTTLVVRPLGAQDPSVWDQIEDRLRRVTRHAASQSWQHPGGDLVVRLFRRVLPDFLPLEPDRIAQVEHEVVVGRSITGDAITWCPDARPHLTVVGVTGGGKGIFLRLILAHAAAHGWRVNVLNPKRSGEYGWLRDRVSIAKTLPGMAAMVAATHAEMQARQDLLDTAGLDTWQHHPTLTSRHLLVLDESAALIGTGHRGDDAATRRIIAAQLADIVAMGRSAGVHVVIVTQHGVADSFGPSGSTVKANTTARVVVGNTPPEGLRMMFGPDLPPTTVKALSAGTPGRCLYQGLNPADGARITTGQIFYAAQGDLPDLPAEPAALPIDYDHPPTNTEDDQ